MVPAATEDRAGKAGDGRARTREAKMACLFTQTITDDDGCPVRDPGSSSYLATFDPASRFGQLVDAEARRRGSEQIRQLVVLGDGAVWIWNLASELFPHATQIVDLYHAREHVHELANLAARLLAGPRRMARHPVPPGRTRRRRNPSAAGRWPRPALHRLAGPRTRQGPGLLRNQRPPDALQALPRPGPVRRLRRGRSRLQSRHRAAAQTIGHEMDRPRRHQHRHPALPTSQQPLGTDLAAAPQPDNDRHTRQSEAPAHSEHAGTG